MFSKYFCRDCKVWNLTMPEYPLHSLHKSESTAVEFPLHWPVYFVANDNCYAWVAAFSVRNSNKIQWIWSRALRGIVKQMVRAELCLLEKNRIVSVCTKKQSRLKTDHVVTKVSNYSVKLVIYDHHLVPHFLAHLVGQPKNLKQSCFVHRVSSSAVLAFVRTSPSHRVT